MLALGIDVVDREAWRRRLLGSANVSHLAFTEGERNLTGENPDELTEIWAIKEAIAKALGTGFDGIGWHGIEMQSQTRSSLRVLIRSDHPEHRRFPTVLDGQVSHLDRYVLAVVVDSEHSTGHAVRTEPVRGSPHRAQRRLYQRAAARLAAERAAADVFPTALPRFCWCSGPSGAPELTVDGGVSVAVSLSHVAGCAAAVVARPTDGCGEIRPGHGPVFEVAVSLQTRHRRDSLS